MFHLVAAADVRLDKASSGPGNYFKRPNFELAKMAVTSESVNSDALISN